MIMAMFDGGAWFDYKSIPFQIHFLREMEQWNVKCTDHVQRIVAEKIVWVKVGRFLPDVYVCTKAAYDWELHQRIGFRVALNRPYIPNSFKIHRLFIVGLLS